MNSDEFKRMAELEEDHFWFKARRDELRPWLVDANRMAPEGPVLDIGAGTGRNLQLLRETCGARQVIGIDRSHIALSHCLSGKSRAELIRSDATTLPLRSSSVALVSALDVLEHLENDVQAVREFARCLRPGGELITTVPAHPKLYAAHDRALGHVRRYRGKELEQKLEAAGFEIIDARPFNSLLLPLVAIWRFSPLHILSSRKKSHMSDVRSLPPLLNDALGTVLGFESSFLAHFTRIPGLSWWIRARLRTSMRE
ncbi:MAG: SAM-dependent methyltransferase [Planctomycetota bacterium]|jgi:SAM-dependent methyltransferase